MKIKCKICNREVKGFRGLSSHLKGHKISPKDYYDKFEKKDGEGICKFCGKKTKSYGLRGYLNYCSIKCGRLGKKHTQKTKDKLSKNSAHYWKGRKFTQESKDKNRNAHLGKRHTQESKDKMSLSHSGDKSHFWKGGISCESYCQDWTNEYKEYIRERDNNKCQNPVCSGKIYKGALHVHHIDYDKKIAHLII